MLDILFLFRGNSKEIRNKEINLDGNKNNKKY